MRSTATILLVLCTMTPAVFAQTVETFVASPLVADYLALDKSTGDLYTTNYSQVSRITPNGSIQVVANATTFVTGLGVSSTGDLYFSDGGSSTIFKRDTNGNITPFVTDLPDVVGIWMSQNNDGLYTQTLGGSIYFVNFDGTATGIVTGLDAGMTDIALDETGTMYVAYFSAGVINKVESDGTATELATLPSSWVGYITYANGYIYATAWQTHQIYRIDVATGLSEVIAGTGTPGLTDGDALTVAEFNEPNGILASVTGDTLYVTDFKSNALRRIIGATTVALEGPDEQPEGFVLAQNYPNPFNPSTSIPYTVQRTGPVTLTVIDMMGREVETLVSQTQAPGTYTVTWDARNYPSGVYLYRLETEAFTQSRTMILSK